MQLAFIYADETNSVLVILQYRIYQHLGICLVTSACILKGIREQTVLCGNHREFIQELGCRPLKSKLVTNLQSSMICAACITIIPSDPIGFCPKSHHTGKCSLVVKTVSVLHSKATVEDHGRWEQITYTYLYLVAIWNSFYCK